MIGAYDSGGTQLPFLLEKFPKNDWRKKNVKLFNDYTFLDYFFRLQELYINMFEWKNLPDTVNERFLELTLFEYGYAVYFNDEELGNLALTCTIAGRLNIYREPIYRRAYGVNGYQKELTENDSVMIYNNYLRQPAALTILLYAKRLSEIERTIEVNVKAQKTPILIRCDEHELKTMREAYKQYTENSPLVIASKNTDLQSFDVLKTDAPYVADRLETLKRQIWSEALTYCGIENTVSEKKERLVTDEVSSNLGSTYAQRYVALNARRMAAKQINDMFGTNIEVDFKQNIPTINFDGTSTTDSEFTESEVERIERE